MAGGFPRLFEPIAIAGHTIPNRIVFAPHSPKLAGADDLPSEAEVAYFAERAAGGVGLLVVGTQMLTPNAVFDDHVTLASDPRVVPGYSALTEAIHAYGAKALVQLSHLGRQMRSLHALEPLWAPSALPCPLARETPKAMDDDDVAALLAAVAQSARHAREGGFTDCYGGSLENRARIVVEALRAVRAGLGPDRIVGLRLNGDDFTPGGLTAADACAVAQHLAATGLVDYFHVSGATYNARPVMVADMSQPLAPFVPLAAAVRRAAGLPVMVVNRIPDPALAEQILSEGHADLIALARPLIADPQWANKARRGQVERIRYCVGANVCHARVNIGVRIACIYNPEAGNELAWGLGTLGRAQPPKRVLVVGGGPAGLEAARVAALRGHEVRLCERAEDLGGQVGLAAKPASRAELGQIVRYFRQELQRLGVAVHLGCAVAADAEPVAWADAVVVATGARPLRSGYTPARPDVLALPGVEQPHVVTLWDALAQPERVGRRVAIVDDQGDVQVTGAAEYLADRGCEVAIVTRFTHVGNTIYPGSYGPERRRLAERGVRCHVDSLVSAVEPAALVGHDVYSERPWRVEPLDTVVLAMGCAPEDGLYAALRARGKPAYAAGDCVAPRGITEAVYEGHKVARLL
ncbi:MAG: FAD-dependent oxidoreductase [Chloroflexi bacterium]|nr:FAD-dependent oxidoreductase [Chloroflexota bacterium]